VKSLRNACTGIVPVRATIRTIGGAAAAIMLGAAARRHPRLARVAGFVWAALTAEFALHRILPGPRKKLGKNDKLKKVKKKRFVTYRLF